MTKNNESNSTPKAKARHSRKRRAKVITVAGRKGGVGKSFIVKMLALNAASGGPDGALRKLKTLIVEVDSQQNVSYYFLKAFGAVWVKNMDKAILPSNPSCPENAVYNVADIFMGNDFMEYPTAFSNLFILPSDGSIDTYIDKLNQYHEHDICKFASQMFKEFIELVRGDYDLIVIDTPPTKTYACRAAIAATDDVLIVTELDVEGAENAIPGILGDIKQVNELYRNSDQPVSILGILPNKISSKRLNKIEIRNFNTIYSNWPDYIHEGLFFTKRVDFQTTEIPDESKKMAYMKNKSTAKMVSDFYKFIEEGALADIYARIPQEGEPNEL
jgi:chromosome partitioning protein